MADILRQTGATLIDFPGGLSIEEIAAAYQREADRITALLEGCDPNAEGYAYMVAQRKAALRLRGSVVAARQGSLL